MTPRAAARCTPFLLLIALAGCGASDPTVALRRELIDANSKIDHLTADNLDLQQQLRQRDEQVRALQALGEGKRLEKLFLAKRIEVGDRSGGASLDGKPGDSGVKVYLEPMDQYGSAIKAAGEVTVELYDLAAPPEQNLVCTCRYGVEEVGKKWINGFLTQQYVFECSWGADQPKHAQLTIRVAFVDYLTGLTLTDQKVVSVTLRPASQPATASAPAASSGPATSAPTAASGPTATPAPTATPRPSPSPSPAPPAIPAPSPRPASSPATIPASVPSGWAP
jgi:hypothetical protein